MEDIMLDIKDIQRYLRCGHNKAYKIIQTKGFPRIKIGGRYYIPQKEFEKWLKAYLYSDVEL